MIACMAGAARASADDGVPYRIDYRPAPSCPGIEHFAEQLSARTRRLLPAKPGAAALTFVVEITETAGAVEGRLLLVEAGGNSTERAVPGSNCVEVLDAMALIAAVTVDPGASLGPLPEAEPKPPPVVAEPAAPPAPTTPPPSRTYPSGWGVGTALSVESNLAPDPLPALGVYAELWGERRGPWAPYARAGLHRAQSGTIDPPADAAEGLRSGHSQLTWLSGRLLACPVAFSVERIVGRPCGSFDLGVLRGRGYFADGEGPATQTTVWMAAGVAVEVELLVSERLLVGVDAGLATTLRRGQFFLSPRYFGQPQSKVHEIGAFAAHGGLRVGLRFF